ncbi:hypothetical protein [Marinoscillum sp.]|uniref:hypothetical protein n=1 Tax=Marinoscillum sp. TaxID=2024838 RepID=UPI003BAC5193
MDELKEAWGSLKRKTEGFTNLTEDEIKFTVNTKSKGIIAKLRRGVKYKLGYAIFFTIAFAIIIPFAFPLASQILLCILLMAYAIGGILLYQELQILNKGVNMDNDILTGLKQYRDRIKRVIRYEEIVGLTMYPISTSGGFFLGMQLVDREAVIMDKAWHWVTLIITVLLFTVIGHFAAKKMNEKAFGKYLAQLEDNIEMLEG